MSEIRTALEEAKKLIDNYLLEDIDCLESGERESLTHIIKSLNAGCGCDDYNGFNCGCSSRASIAEMALEELSKIE